MHNRYVLLVLGCFAIAQWVALLRGRLFIDLFSQLGIEMREDVAIRDARWNERAGACIPIGAHEPLREYAILYFPSE